MVKQYKFNPDELFSTLDQLPEKTKTEFSISEIVKTSRAKISNALKKGYTFVEITEWFNKSGCDITAKELETAYNKLKQSTRKKPKSLNEQNTPVNTDSAPSASPVQNLENN